MSLGEIVGLAATIIAVVVPVLWAAFKWWGSAIWATRKELNGFGQRVDQLRENHSVTREKVDEVSDRQDRIEQEQNHQNERIAEQVIQPLRQISEQLTSLTTGQSEQKTATARLQESMKGIKVSMDDLRKRVERAEDRGAV